MGVDGGTNLNNEPVSMAGARSAAQTFFEPDRPTPAGDLPFPVPAAVLRAQSEVDWTSFLPPSAGTAQWRAAYAVKRGLDVVLSLSGLVVLSPLLLLLAGLVAATSKGPILYEWRVLGRHARPFRGYKFRTMVENADELKQQFAGHNEMTGPVFKMRNDPRVTPVGRWMRKFSLDELPQLWSVLRGDMSLVGPRPPGPHEFEGYAPWQRGKLAVTPGITCLWQVSGRSEITDFDEWMRLDLQYIREWSLWLDAKILLRTLPAVLRGHGAY
jgi:lipopolysaccharide/colanic/teichoic acid biosynthesis glycosyltransferase